MTKACEWDSRAHYERLIRPIRDRARELGYAVGVHGTLVRDIDLIAVPWTEGAAPARQLAEAIFAVVETVNGQAHWSWYPGRGQEFTLNGGPGTKPHGQLGWVINLTLDGPGPYIDLSVMPRDVKCPECNGSGADVSHSGGVDHPPEASVSACPYCEGTGRVRDYGAEAIPS